MESSNEDKADATSIKPVSSLRARFEGLNTNDAASNETQSKTGDRLDTPQPAGVFRVSLDIPRPESPWNLYKQGGGNHTPRTPREPRSGAGSPTKATHKRPRSMQIGSSPKLTPSVNVEVPKSPPRSYFFNRGVSSSPERSPLNRVQDLVSKHTSRSTSHPGTPKSDGGDNKALEENNGIRVVNERLGQHIEGTKIGPLPPPVNRADKPKIPAKPAPLTASDLSALVPQDRKMSVERRVSPFTTPPSSGEDSPTARGSPDHSKRRGSSQTGVARSQTITGTASQAVSRIPAVLTDPRHMGFAPPRSTERRDPRTMGLSAVLPRTGDKKKIVGGAPARANTVSTRSSARDTRDIGFSTARPTPRHVSESVKPMPPPTRRENAPSPRAGPIRDPRQFGFSGPVSSITLAEEDRPGLPPRRTEPPPRPSDATKAGGHTQQHHAPPSGAVGKTIVADERLQAAPLKPPTENEGHFPPPPKRNTFPEPDPARPPVRPTPNAQSGPTTRVADQSRNSTRPPDPDDSDQREETVDEPVATRTDYPDSSQANRRPPQARDSVRGLLFKSDARVFDASGQNICTTGYATRVYDLSNADKVMEISHGETVKGLSVIFKPGNDFESEGTRIWVGNNIGDLQEYDIATHSLVADSKAHNRREIVRILRHKKDLWSLDDAGNLFVWPAHEGKSPSLKYSHQSIRVQKGHTFSLVVQDQLWLACGKELRVYKPGHEASFKAVDKMLIQPGTGEVTSGSYTTQQGGRAYFGHTDGKVTIYSIKDYTCLGNVKVSDYKINVLAFVGDWLWAAYKTGKIYVYDTSTTPWKVKKDWKAHEGPAAGLLLDPSSIWTMQRMQVISLGQTDQCLRLWDGMLEDDWLETAMHDKDIEYCSFREIKAAVVTWNVGAANPMDVRPDMLRDAIHPEDPPEVLAFGFQEVVDLEDRAVTAKSILGFGKKKDKIHTEQPVGRVYREWSAFLAKCISRCMVAGVSYSELHTSSLIGLFQCIFVRSDVRTHIRNMSAVDVKCGMKGHYGNKGALVTRFILDDTSLCFVNCHLAAGQTSTAHRNNDIATILESDFLPIERDPDTRSSLFVGGGDGDQILDHEICILNGDLNYRIDAIPRNTVVDMIKRNDLSKLLERDQIMLSRRRVSGFRLSPFVESQITFAPTYKYDVGTDNYDSSEKRRAPAWCDRLLYRGPGRIKQVEYRRHEVRVSDHRPVSGLFKIRVKSIDHERREKMKVKCHKAFGEVSRRLTEQASVDFLVSSLGLGEKEARANIAQK